MRCRERHRRLLERLDHEPRDPDLRSRSTRPAPISEGFACGYMTAAEKAMLVNAINTVIGANNVGPKLRGFISQVQSSTAAQLNQLFQDPELGERSAQS